MDRAPTPVEPGARIAGRYRVERLLGQGGMGAVFLATDLSSGGAVALKVVLPEAMEHGEGRARFRREAELARGLSHPNLVRLLDFDDGDPPFIAWELLEGRGLDAELGALGCLPPARAVRIAAQVLDALVTAHAAGIVHRDIKPANLFLCGPAGGDDRVKVLDFGIAKRTHVERTALTREGALLGTPAYMAPEQVRGEGVSARTDLYALGLVLAEMLTGQKVFAGPVMAAIQAQLSPDPAPLPPALLASPFGPVIARATEKGPERRFGSAAEMRAALLAAAGPEEGWTMLPGTVPGAPAGVSEPRPAVGSPLAYAPTIAAGPNAGFDPTIAAGPNAGFAPIFPAPPPRGRRAALLVGGGLFAGVLLAGAVAAVVAARSGDDAPGKAVGHRGAPTASAAASGSKRFGLLTTAQVRARIEAAGYRIREESPSGLSVTFVLTTPGHYVQVLHWVNEKAVDPYEELLAKSGTVARDGPALLVVRLGDKAAERALVARIDR